MIVDKHTHTHTHTHTHSLKWLGRLFGPEKREETEVFLGL